METGSIVAGEGADGLVVIVLENGEVLLFKAGDEAVHGVSDGEGNEDDVGIDAELDAGAQGSAGGEGDGSGLGGDGNRGRRIDVDLVQGVFG